MEIITECILGIGQYAVYEGTISKGIAVRTLPRHRIGGNSECHLIRFHIIHDLDRH